MQNSDNKGWQSRRQRVFSRTTEAKPHLRLLATRLHPHPFPTPGHSFCVCRCSTIRLRLGAHNLQGFAASGTSAMTRLSASVRLFFDERLSRLPLPVPPSLIIRFSFAVRRAEWSQVIDGLCVTQQRQEARVHKADVAAHAREGLA